MKNDASSDIGTRSKYSAYASYQSTKPKTPSHTKRNNNAHSPQSPRALHRRPTRPRCALQVEIAQLRKGGRGVIRVAARVARGTAAVVGGGGARDTPIAGRAVPVVRAALGAARDTVLAAALLTRGAFFTRGADRVVAVVVVVVITTAAAAAKATALSASLGGARDEACEGVVRVWFCFVRTVGYGQLVVGGCYQDRGSRRARRWRRRWWPEGPKGGV